MTFSEDILMENVRQSVSGIQFELKQRTVNMNQDESVFGLQDRFYWSESHVLRG